MNDEIKKDDLINESTVEEENSFENEKNFKGRNNNSGDNFYKKIWFWVLVVIAVVGVGGTAAYAQHKQHQEATAIVNQLEQEQNQSNNQGNSSFTSKTISNNSVNGQDQSISIASTGEVLTESPNNDNSKAKEVTLKAGAYEVGKDVMPGYYTVTLTGTGKIDIYDANGNELLQGSVSEGSSTGTATVKVQLNQGEKIDLSGFEEAKLTPYVHKYLSTLNEGTYTVGDSVKAGKYTIDIPAGAGSVSVLNSLGIPVYNEMTTEGQNNNEAQKVNLDLQNGDIININGINGVKLSN